MSASATEVSFFQAPDYKEAIRQKFYNDIACYVLDLQGVTEDMLPILMPVAVEHTINNILLESQSCPGIRLPQGFVITPHNCPAEYLTLFNGLLALKNTTYVDGITALAQKIMKDPLFQAMNPTQRILNILGIKPATPEHHYDETGITVELIRRRFYKEMSLQLKYVVDTLKLITVDDLMEQKGELYTILPALTILKAIHKSLDCPGILLSKNKLVNKTNCPDVEIFPEFISAVLEIKESVPIHQIKEEHFDIANYLIASSVGELPPALQFLKTAALMAFVAQINSLASRVSQRPVFYNMSATIMEKYLNSIGRSINEAISVPMPGM